MDKELIISTLLLTFFSGVVIFLLQSMGVNFCGNEELTFNYEINFKGNECHILNDKFVICKYKTLDDLEINDFEGVTTNGK